MSKKKKVLTAVLVAIGIIYIIATVIEIVNW